MNPTYRTIVGKRDTRAYRPDPIPGEVLHRLLTAARMAGSAKNGQPVRYVAIASAAQRNALAAHGGWTTPLRNAPLVVVVLLERGKNVFDAGRAAQNLMLAAWAEGIASCPVSVYPDEAVRGVLGHPEDLQAVIAIALGYPQPGTPMGRGQRRLSLDSLVHFERYGGAPPA
jgi:nitroreductase